MKSNLKTRRYRNGDLIPSFPDAGAWSGLTTGAFVHYENDDKYDAAYGKLYNWYAAVDNRGICPTGWHLPTLDEWSTLINYLGGEAVAGGKLKLPGTDYWLAPNSGASNESGFSALPAGYRGKSSTGGAFDALGRLASWWTATETSASNAVTKIVGYDYESMGILESYGKEGGVSIRCVKD